MSGRTCQVWAASQPHEHKYADVGEHNYCRNPSPNFHGGVWCYTTDPDKRLEICSVPICDATYNCQEGDPLGVSYAGQVNTTASGRTCKVWSETSVNLGEHNYCRNPEGNDNGVWCFTTDPDKPRESCSLPRCDVTMLRVLDFSADNDNEPDSNGEFTKATLNAGFIPESFTICSAIMTDAWTTDFTSARMFTLLDDVGNGW